MLDDRLPTERWVTAHLRQCTSAAVPVYVVRRGDKHGGMVMLKLNQLDAGCRVLSQTRDFEGRRAWLGAFSGERVPEAEADAYIARAVDRDPDLWVVEIEPPEGWHPLEGEVV